MAGRGLARRGSAWQGRARQGKNKNIGEAKNEKI